MAIKIRCLRTVAALTFIKALLAAMWILLLVRAQLCLINPRLLLGHAIAVLRKVKYKVLLPRPQPISTRNTVSPFLIARWRAQAAYPMAALRWVAPGIPPLLFLMAVTPTQKPLAKRYLFARLWIAISTPKAGRACRAQRQTE